MFRSLGRAAALGAAAAIGALLAVRLRGSGAQGQRCVNRGLCRSCGIYERCGLPNALALKEAAS